MIFQYIRVTNFDVELETYQCPRYHGQCFKECITSADVAIFERHIEVRSRAPQDAKPSSVPS
jgi:hypothetical protein